MDAIEAKKVVWGQFCSKFDSLHHLLTFESKFSHATAWRKEANEVGQACRRLVELLGIECLLEFDASGWHSNEVYSFYLLGLGQVIKGELQQFCTGLDVALWELGEGDGCPNIANELQKWLPGLTEAGQDKLLKELRWFYAQEKPPLTKPLRRRHFRRYLICRHFGLEQKILTKAAEQLVMSYWSGWLGAEFSRHGTPDEKVLPVVQKVISMENIGIARLEQLVQGMTGDIVESSEVKASVQFITRVKNMKLRLPALTALQLVPPIRKYVVELAGELESKRDDFYIDEDSYTKSSLPFAIQLLEELLPKPEHAEFVLCLVKSLKKDRSEWGWPFYGTWVAGLMKKFHIPAKLVHQFDLSYKQRISLVMKLAGPPELLREIELADEKEKEGQRAWRQQLDEKVRQSNREERERLANALSSLEQQKK